MAPLPSAEIAVVGNEGVVGTSLFGESTTSRTVVQSAGRAFRLRAISQFPGPLGFDCVALLGAAAHGGILALRALSACVNVAAPLSIPGDR
jgi:hypothetical protein